MCLYRAFPAKVLLVSLLLTGSDCIVCPSAWQCSSDCPEEEVLLTPKTRDLSVKMASVPLEELRAIVLNQEIDAGGWNNIHSDFLLKGFGYSVIYKDEVSYLYNIFKNPFQNKLGLLSDNVLSFRKLWEHMKVPWSCLSWHVAADLELNHYFLMV